MQKVYSYRHSLFVVVVCILLFAAGYFMLSKKETKESSLEVDFPLLATSTSLSAANLFILMSPIEHNSPQIADNELDDEFFAALVKPMDQPVIFYEKNTGARWPIASLTKLLTAIVALERLGSDAVITLSQNAIDTEGASGGFFAGEKYTVRDLIKAMMLVSSNDAAAALAEALGTAEFLNFAQKKLIELRMFDTTIADAIGLSPLNQSTVLDLEKLMRYIYLNKSEILKMSQNETARIVERRSGRARALKSINQFSGQQNFVGGKTGFLDESGGNLISIFRYYPKTDQFEFANQSQDVLIIVMGAKDRFAATQKLYDQLSASQQ